MPKMSHLSGGKDCFSYKIPALPMREQLLQDWLAAKQTAEKKLDKAPLSAQEREELSRFDRLWEAARASDSLPLEVDTSAAWDKVEDRLFGQEEGAAVLPSTTTRRGFLAIVRPHSWKIAAAISLLLIATWWWQRDTSSAETIPLLAFTTAIGEQQAIELPDGSKVWLNAASSLTYDPNAPSQRSVTLVGEAFFEVARDEDKPFVIQTGDVVTTVLGTSFNIRAYADEDLEVAVNTGQVAVQNERTEQTVVLQAADVATYQRATAKLVKEQQVAVPSNAWVAGRLEAKGQSLRSLLLALERFYDQKFIVDHPALLDCTLTAVFLQSDMEAAIDLLEFQFGPLLMRGDTIRLQGQRCN